MNPEMTTPISDLASLAALAWIALGAVATGGPRRVLARLAKRAGKGQR